MEETPPHAIALWRELAGDPAVLAPGSRATVRNSRGLCPDGWTGVLRLGDAVAVEVAEASDRAVDMLLSLDDPTDLEAVRVELRPGRILGPGVLHHVPAGTGPPPPVHELQRVEADDLTHWIAELPPDDVGEAGADELDPAWVVEVDGRRAGIAGWTPWPCETAHLGIVVDPSHRGRGIGTSLARGVTAAALDAGLQPQWRAAAYNPASIATARSAGYVETGRQLSVADLAV